MNHEKVETQQSPEEILRDAVLRVKALEEKWQNALEQRNGKLAGNAMVEKGKIVRTLPKTIKQSMEAGNPFPEDKLNDLEHCAQQADEFIRHKNSPGLIFLLYLPLGAKKNIFEEIIEELYPEKK